MNPHQFLARVHEICRPRAYFEIGIDEGGSLALSRARTVAVDPNFQIRTSLRCDLRVVKATSDDFFAGEDPFAHFGEVAVDLAFVDGMHLFEYVLRDFINTEKYAGWSSVIVLDGLLPANHGMASRNPVSGVWTGDVYKLIAVLQKYRPELRLALLDTKATGTMAIFGADPTSTVLSDKYDEILENFVLGDPQQVPRELLARSGAMEPEVLLQAPFWDSLIAARGSDDSSYGREQLLADIDKALENAPKPSLADWRPNRGTQQQHAVAEELARGRQAAAKAATTPKKSSANDLFRGLARRAPWIRRLPGAAALARMMRAGRP